VSPIYLLDTNVISEPLRPQPHPNVLARLQQHEKDISIASVVWHELYFGCSKLPASARRTAIEQYLANVVARSMPILPYDERAAFWHAAERARLAQQGLTPPYADGQIASIARTNQLILVTFNVADFANFASLPIEDWRAQTIPSRSPPFDHQT
jgi:tRNA(fMet)-specific endonuclease VapC